MASATTVPPSHQLPCTPDEVSRAACLNGGTCFAWDSGGGTRSVGCSCTSEWTGNRCEYMYIDPYDWAVSDAASQTIALAVILPLILIFVVVAVLVFFVIKKKRREKKTQEFQRTAASPQNGSLKAKYDCPDMSTSTQRSTVSNSPPLSFNGNQTNTTVVWESAV